MIHAAELVDIFDLMYREHWAYEWGAHEKGCVDCSGAFTYAFSLFGMTIPNGSNAIARRYTVGGMLPIIMARPGMAAFKVREPGEAKYDLPDKYKSGGPLYNGDIGDYYHIGLVDDDPRYVLNAKGKAYGFSRDLLAKSGGWDFVAYLKGVDYDSEAGTEMEAKVVLPEGKSGTTVNMRKQASLNSNVIARVPVGSTVLVGADMGQWCRISYNGQTGYMQSNYIEYAGQGDETGSLSGEETARIEQALRQLEQCKEIIQQQIDAIGAVVGRG